MDKIISENLNNIKELCLKHNIKQLFLFGSASTDKLSESSDIDLLASFKKMDTAKYAENYFDALYDFEKIFNRSVDLVADTCLSNPYFIKSVNQTKVLIYGE